MGKGRGFSSILLSVAAMNAACAQTAPFTPEDISFVPYDAGEDVNKAPQCAMQFVIAENEELFDDYRLVR
jgi:hypothetical protein